MSAPIDVLVVNLGTPRAPTAEAVRDFLAEFLSDPLVVDYPRWLWLPILNRIILRRRPKKVAELYREIWAEGGSPLAVGTQEIATGLQERLGDDYRVRVVYRYGQPSLEDELRRLLLSGESHDVRVIPLFPQRTQSSSGSVLRLVSRVERQCSRNCRVTRVLIPPDDPGWAAAQRARCAEALSSPPDHWLVSFHGIPVRHDGREGGRYQADCQLSAETWVRTMRLPSEDVSVAFQSRFGPDRWLTPATDTTIADLAKAGCGHLAVVTPGFATETLETVEELGIRGKETFLSHGGTVFTLVPTVRNHPLFLDGLARRVADKNAVPS